MHLVFKTPLPNPSLWQGNTVGQLSNPDIFTNGGWWHDPCILSATGGGVEIEEPRAWEGWWNEKIVELVRLSMKQSDALTVLLTGRSEKNFSGIVKRIVASKGLEFDMIGLKPLVSPSNQKFQSTMHYKQIFLNDLMETYRHAEEIRIYEDRPKHTKGFRDFLAEYNRRQGMNPTRGQLTAEVIQVADQSTTLDPVMEIAQIQLMINQHNDAVVKEGKSKKQLYLKKTTFFTSYMLEKADRERLLAVANIQSSKNESLNIQGSNVVITPRPPSQQILDKVGGMGAKMSWRVIAIGNWQDKVWAALLEPVPRHAPYHVENAKPWVVLAVRKGSKPVEAKHIKKWDTLPEDQSFVFETTVGERVVMRIDTEGDDQENRGQNKRKHPGDESDFTSKAPNGRHDSRGYHTSAGRGGGRGGRGRGDRGNQKGGRGRGRGRGGQPPYRSLDDVNQNQGGFNAPVSYDDAYPALGSGSGGKGNRGGNNGGSQGRPLGGQSSGGQDLQNYY